MSRRGLLLGALALAGSGGTAVAWGRGRSAPPPARLTLATGPHGAVFVEVGADIARALRARSPRTDVTVQVTAATVDNLSRLTRGLSDLGFASLDAAADDFRVRQQQISALSRVYDSRLHLVVRAESGIESLMDLEGRTVSIGGSGSGTEFTTLRLLDVTGVRPARLLRLGQTPGMAAVADGRVDGAFSLTGVPTPAITELAARRPIRLVPLAEHFGFLDREIPHAYQPAFIPAGSYPGVDSVGTLLVPNLLLARPGLPDAPVRLVLDVLFADASRAFWTHPESRQISRQMAVAVGSVSLHPAARDWLGVG